MGDKAPFSHPFSGTGKLFSLQGRMIPLTDMELDVPLTPQKSQSSKVNFPTGEFQKEKLSPQSGR